jgi:uncharacterized protein (DUF488 family)
MTTLFTIGHSTHELTRFLDLLKQHNIQAIGDVRSQPYSSRFPQYSKEALEKSLKENQIRYVFLGKELGARRSENCCYVEGQAKYELIAKNPAFAQGIERVIHGLSKYRLALLCSERDPLTCHRTVLVCKHLRGRGFDIEHILADGSLESQEELETRMLKMLGKGQPTLFASREETVEQAYEEQGGKIAYRQSQNPKEAVPHVQTS